MIVSEPSNPWVNGVAGLFPDEFYARINDHLNDRGLFVQWVQLYEIDIELVVSVLKTISSNFSDYAVYASQDADLFINARKNGSLPDPEPHTLEAPVIAAVMRRIYIENMQDIELRHIGGKKVLEKFIQSFSVRANSDYYPLLDQNTARARFLGKTVGELTIFMHFPMPILEMLSGKRYAWNRTDIHPSPYFLESEAANAPWRFATIFSTSVFSLTIKTYLMKQSSRQQT